MIPFSPANPANYTRGRKGAKVSVIVIHVMQGSLKGTEAWFKNAHARVSAHYLVGRDGSVIQMVQEGNTAWHARNANQSGIGIELEGFVEHPDNFTYAQLKTTALLVRDICKRYGLPADRQHVKGHNEIPGNNHTDPGTHFPWGLFMSLVKT